MRNRWDGKPGLYFAGAQQLESTVQTNRPTKDMTIFAVASCGYKGSFPELVTWGPGTTNGFDLYFYTGVAPLYRPNFIRRGVGAAWGDHWAVQAGATRPNRDEPMILCGYVSGGTTGVRWDKGNETTDAGTDVNTDYGTEASVKLMVGGKHGSNMHQGGFVSALLIYNRKLSAAEITLVEDWLDRQWRVTYQHRQYLLWFNGSIDAVSYRMGLAWSPDGRHWKRRPANPVLSQGVGWESSHVKDPCVLWDGAQWIMYYAGYNGTNYQIGRATSPDGIVWTKAAGNPLVAVGAGGTFDDFHVYFPWVVYDAADADATRRWKMLYGADDGAGIAGGISVGYATSADGVTWTKRGQVLTKGSSGAWDEGGVSVGCFRYNAALARWELWHQGVTTAGVWQGGFATAATPAGPWTKHASNPQAPASRSATNHSKTLTSTMAASATAVNVSSPYAWELWEPLAIGDATSEIDLLGHVVELASSTQVLVSNGPDSQMDSGGGTVRSFAFRSVITRSIVDRGSELVSYGTNFQVMDDLGVPAPKLKELAHRATATAPEGPYTFDLVAGILLLVDSDGVLYDHRAAENPAVVARPAGT